MANYSLVANSTFQPFTYQELMAPIQRMSDYHERLADEYDKLSSQADVLEAMGADDRDKNSKAYGQYKSYSDALRKEADELYRFGLNTESRRRLSELRKRYNTDIVPIQNAWSKREKEALMQQEAQMKNPNLRFTRTASETALQDYIDNPMGGYGVVDLGNISAQMSDMAKNLAKQKREGRLEGIDAYTNNFITPYGLDPNLISDWQNNPDISPTLTNMMQQVLAANGITTEDFKNSPNGARILQEAIGAAQRGAWSAVGEDKSQILDNYGARLNAQAAKELGTYRAKKDIDMAYAQQSASSNNPINPLPIRSAQEIDSKNQQIREYIRKGFVKQSPNGQWVMTPAGWNEYRKMSANDEKALALLAAGGNWDAKQGALRMPDTVPSKFRTFMDELNGGNPLVDESGKVLPGWGPNRAGNLFASGIRRYEEGSYDTYHSTEYDRQIPSSYGNTFTEQLWSAARREGGKKVLDTVDFDGKNGWKEGKALSTKDLAGYRVTNVRYSRYGNTAILQKDGEEPIRVKIPRGVNIGAEGNISAAIANADENSWIIQRGKRPRLVSNSRGEAILARDGNGEIIFTDEDLTPEDVYIFEMRRRQALDEMSSYGSQLVVPSTTANDEYKPFGF